ncbi:MAG: class I SAM-dependent methyltransferase [Burkholderiaceae bacterium]
MSHDTAANAGHADQLSALDSWLTTPRGRYVLDWERTCISRTVQDVFGFYAVQLGLAGLPALEDSRIASRMLVLPTAGPLALGTAWTGQLQADYARLPLASDSIDLLVMPHVLEFAADPHSVLREAERVLIPEGQLVITGFNPLSSWGAMQKMLGRRWPVWPRTGEPISLPRLKDWLKLLGLELNHGRFGCYRLPRRSARGLQSMAFMEKAGDRWWPVCGAVYMISAVKRVHGMRLIIKPEWNAPAALGARQRVAKAHCSP